MPRNSLSSWLIALAIVSTSQAAFPYEQPAARQAQEFAARLDPLEVVPAVSSLARGRVSLQLEPGGDGLRFELRYVALEGEIAPVHLRLGQPGVNGGALAWLCGTTADPGPPGTAACPASPGVLSGRLAAGDVVGPRSQGVEGGDLDALVAALQEGLVYASVRSSRFPDGEVRGQLRAEAVGNE